jgi:hypothetical protein
VESHLTLEDVLLHVEQLEQRVAALEQSISGTVRLETPRLALAAPRAATLELSGGAFATVAKALLGFAGAYLLRAIADSGAIPQFAGVAAGIAYALFWLIWSVRLPSSDGVGSTLYGLTSALIFAGVLWENSVELHNIPVKLGALLIAMFACFGLVLSWRRELPGTAAIVTSVASLLGLGLLLATHHVVPLTGTLLALAAGSEIAACNERWPKLRPFPALAADLGVAIMTWVITRPQGVPESYPPFGMSSVIALQIILLLIFAGSTAYRTVIKGSDITRFEITQNVLGFGLFIWGALAMGGEAPAARFVVGLFCLVAGSACYATAVLLLAHKSRQRNFLMYGIFGLALLMAAISTLFSGLTLIIVLCTLAILSSWLGRHEHRISLQLHTPAFLAVAAGASGLLEFARQALHGANPPSPSRLVPAAIVTVALVLCYSMAGSGESGKARIPAALVAAMLCWSILGLTGAAVTTLLGPGSMISSTLRTGLVCGLALALTKGSIRRIELGWLLYPLMIYGAYRLLVEDFPHGRPTALALSLLFYGGTLLGLTRMLRSS